jgi:ferredoxin-NADP reductase
MSQLKIVDIDKVGADTIALVVESPPGFEAYPGQFVSISTTIDGEKTSRYYTISSPDVEETFEMTVAIDPDGVLGPWFDERSVGDEITVEGPFGEIRYMGVDDAFVFAGGPGIGPAVGIAERARNAGRDAAIVYAGQEPAHAERLDALEAAGATVIRTDDLAAAVDSIDTSGGTSYVFGFEGFIQQTKDALAAAGVDMDSVEMESFGPA